MQFTTDTRALQFLRQFHRKRILRFAAGHQFKDIEDKNDLERSQRIVSKVTEILGEQE
jgi:hypothetical protein